MPRAELYFGQIFFIHFVMLEAQMNSRVMGYQYIIYRGGPCSCTMPSIDFPRAPIRFYSLSQSDPRIHRHPPIMVRPVTRLTPAKNLPRPSLLAGGNEVVMPLSETTLKPRECQVFALGERSDPAR